jgi:hypothetical protein
MACIDAHSALLTGQLRDPDLQIMVNGGYFDLAPPFIEGM